MPIIREEVLSGNHLRSNPQERPLLAALLNCFNVNHAYSRRAHSAELSAYFLGPVEGIKQQFGINGEVLLVISKFNKVQPRTLQAVDTIMRESPAYGRVDPTVFFLITNDPNANEWVQNHGVLNPQARIPVIFSARDIIGNGNNGNFIRNEIAKQLYSRDLFNDQLPLKSDTFFFGRAGLVAEFYSAMKQGQNRGLFGLRKTGKTSILFKLRRMSERDNLICIYYDCKDPAIRSLKWDALVERMLNDLIKHLSSSGQRNASSLSRHISDRFKAVVQNLATQNKKICFMFDEIEYISPVSKANSHWHTDFVDFWQTMWTTQSEYRNLSFVIAGVNPSIVETDIINQIQNPVFSIVPPQYVTGFSKPEINALLTHIGNWMGIKFGADAMDYILQRYGGHPLLTRMACSHIHNYLSANSFTRPANIDQALLVSTEKDRESDISQYSRHVISELKGFYHDEYQLLEYLASGNLADFIELSAGFVRHLEGYGLLDNSSPTHPVIKIPMIAKFINDERIIRDKTSPGPYVVAFPHRNVWLKDRVSRIITDIREVEVLAKEQSKPELYGINGFPEADRFVNVTLSSDAPSFGAFINVCNRCFVEPIERVGRQLRKNRYFWNEIKNNYPDFWNALLRIKIYRHEHMHLELDQWAQDALNQLKERDFFGLREESTLEPDFSRQQFVLDGLFTGLQAELERLT